MCSSEGATPSVLMAPCSTSAAPKLSCRSPPCSRAGKWMAGGRDVRNHRRTVDSPEGVGHRKSLTWFVRFHLMVAIFVLQRAEGFDVVVFFSRLSA